MRRALKYQKSKSRIFLATTDSHGVPFIASVNHIKWFSGKCIEIRCCSCSRLLANLWRHPRTLLLVLDEEHDLGLQLTCRLLHMKSTPFTNGYPSEIGRMMASHIEMNLLIMIEEIVEIEQAFHGDKAVPSAGWPVHLKQKLLYQGGLL